LFDFLKPSVLALQDFCILAGRALRNVFRPPHYESDILLQMDVIGVGSLPIVVLIGFFTGVVITMQMSRALAQYGAVDQVGPIVAITLVLGSIKVTEQLDAMRALGTDPIQKLVTPRMIATAVMLPLLTIVSDFVGLIGGWSIARLSIGLSTSQYWTSAYRAIEYNDITQGLLKPFVFAFMVSLVGCFYGLRTTGGTQGVGHATTQAVVVSSVWIFVLTSLLTRIFVNLQ
jgi:phospholipid/cholesterol/gamma-HCH transport system permease protein